MEPKSVAARAVEALMSDRGRVTSPPMASMGALDPVTLEVTPPASEVLWEGICLFQPAASSIESGAGGLTRVTQDVVKVPAGTTGIRVGDVFTLTESASGGMIGVPLEITRVQARSRLFSVTLTVRRLQGVPAPGVA